MVNDRLGLIRRLIAEIAADTMAAYNLAGAGSTVAEDDPADDIDEQDLLSYTKDDRDENNRGKDKLWRSAK